ncbi:MAG TPA: arylsulfatase [Burkholderiales bacterium]|nr:arylsulfatase [Burkholderiales bacterium]
MQALLKSIAVALILTALPLIALPAERPHILYITADDLGWKDVGYHGSSIRTPTLDRLAKEGARLEDFYVQPFSSQTRAAVYTGRYPMRYGLQTMQIQWFSEHGLPTDERILPQALKTAGYRTALIGKWQLGHAQKDFMPKERGYDHFYGHLTGAIDYFKKTDAGGRPDWWRNDKRIKEEGYVTTLLAREASAVIARHEAPAPLFMHLSFAAPQAPHEGVKPFVDYYSADSAQLKAYRAMISAVDNAIDTTLKALEKHGMLNDTVVVFHATTGGAVKRKFPMGDGDSDASVSNNGFYRGGRGGLHEGGLRAAAFVWRPGEVQPGAITEIIHAVDFYPTLLKLAGADLEQPKPIDGIDQWPSIAQGKPSPRQEALLNVDEFRGALRMAEWKLILYATLPSRVELYNLRADPSEEDNQAERDPERVRAMTKRLTEYAWDMAPSKYLEELTKPRKVDTPIFWGENPVRGIEATEAAPRPGAIPRLQR